MSETDDYVAVVRLQQAYADAVTRRAWPEFNELFLPEADIVNSHIELHASGDADVAHARLYICEIRQEHNGRFSQAYGLYQDHYRRRDGRWWISQRSYSSLARTGPDFETHPYPELVW